MVSVFFVLPRGSDALQKTAIYIVSVAVLSKIGHWGLSHSRQIDAVVPCLVPDSYFTCRICHLGVCVGDKFTQIQLQ